MSICMSLRWYRQRHMNLIWLRACWSAVSTENGDESFAQRVMQNARHKSFCFAFYKKRTGVGGAHERKVKKNRNKEKQSEAKIKGKATENTSRMQSIRRRTFSVPTDLHKEKYRTQRNKNKKFLVSLFTKSERVWAEPTREKRSRREIKKSGAKRK